MPLNEELKSVRVLASPQKNRWTLAGLLTESLQEESPGTKEQGCRLTAGQGDLKESATENKPLFALGKE
jgi:hypothetical protein